jgi:hypothetical protein
MWREASSKGYEKILVRPKVAKFGRKKISNENFLHQEFQDKKRICLLF